MAYVLASLPASGAQDNRIDAKQLLAPNQVTEIAIRVADADWQRLCNQARDMSAMFSGVDTASPYSYVKADIVIDGVEIKSVGIRKKGLIGSNDNQRPSLKIKFDEYEKQDPIKGLGRLTLNNNKQDASLISQFLTYKLFRDAGLHAPRTGFAKVTVNGSYLGVYTHVESVRKAFLRDSFGDDSGNLYEGTLTDFYPRTIDKLEAKSKAADKDRSQISRLTTLLARKGELPLDELGKLIDVDDFFRFWAMEGLLRMWDGYASNQNNFFIYMNPKTGLGYFIPWGADQSFSDGGPFARWGGAGGPTSLYTNSVLANRLYNTPGMADRYRRTMNTLLTTVWKEKQILAEIDRLEELLSPHLSDAQRSVPRGMDTLRGFIKSRRDVVAKELSDWPAAAEAQPRKPMYAVPVGSLTGSFTGEWHSRQPSAAENAGKAKLKMKLDGQDIQFEKLGSGAWPMEARRRFGPPGGNIGAPRVSVVLTGIRESDDEQIVVSLTVDRDAFETAKPGTAIKVIGRLTEGRSGGFGFPGFGGGGPMRSVSGTLQLTEAGTEQDAAVRGKVNLQILETRGGLFDRRGRGGRRRPR
jgi:hypothetical protein